MESNNNKHVHITYEDCQKFRQIDFKNPTETEEEWFHDFDYRLNICDTCYSRLERFVQLNLLFPEDVSMVGELIKEKDNLIEVIYKAIDNCEASLKEKLSKWLNGTRSLLSSIPDNSFYIFTPAFRGIDKTDKDLSDGYTLTVEAEGIYNLTVEGNEKKSYTFTVKKADDKIPSILVIYNENQQIQLHELKAIPGEKFGKKSIVLEPGEYKIYVLTQDE